MADLSQSFDPTLIATNSDAASAAGSAAATASDLASSAFITASDALSKITARSAIWDVKTVVLKPIAEDTVVSTADDLMRFTVPDELSGMDLVSCGAHVYTAATSGVVTIDIYNLTDTADMLTSALTIDATEKDTVTAGSAAVINAAEDDVVTADELRIDVTAGASGASGLEVRLVFKKP